MAEAQGTMKLESKRVRLERLRAQLELDRSSFLSHWRDLADYVMPRRARFTVTDVNRGDRRNRNIIDSTATLAVRTLRSGMMSGITSPARPWFRLSTPDPDLAEISSVKQWLYFVTQRMSSVFLNSNLYNVLPIVYGDMGVFGTGGLVMEETFDQSVVHFTPLPIGSYSIANGRRGKVEVLVRDFRMTARQIVEEFGRDKRTGEIDWTNISDFAKARYLNNEPETWIDVSHVIEANPEWNPKKLEARFKRFASTYYERAASGQSQQADLDGGKMLREAGFDFFPGLFPRWEVTGEDSYGTDCPGMTGLGDIRQLQLGEKRRAQAIEKMINPAMTAPTSLRNQKASILPGDITYVDVREGQQGFKPAHDVSLRIQELDSSQQGIRSRIQRVFYEDLFLMLAESDRREITAREVDERHEEKLLALGPVLEQLNQDLLNPLVDGTFAFMLRQRMIPPAPKELQGIPLRVEYVSIMAQAQKLVGTAAIERFAGFVNQLAAVAPTALDNVDVDHMVEVYGELTSVAPGIVRSPDQVQSMRQQRQQQQEQAQRMQALQQGATAAKSLSQTDTSGQNALTDLMDQAKAGQIAPQ